MRQILTILWDSYRLLMAKKLFWVALGLSVFLAVIYASISIGRSEITIFFGAWSIELGDFFLFDNTQGLSGIPFVHVHQLAPADGHSLGHAIIGRDVK